MEASLDKPFRARKSQAGQGTHAQIGPNQTMVCCVCLCMCSCVCLYAHAPGVCVCVCVPCWGTYLCTCVRELMHTHAHACVHTCVRAHTCAPHTHPYTLAPTRAHTGRAMGLLAQQHVQFGGGERSGPGLVLA